MTLPVTAALAIAMATLLLFLAIDTVRQRFRTQIGFGTGDDERLMRASRAHGNLAEHAPIVIILVALLELSQAHHLALMAVSGVFIVGRLLHALGLYMQPPANGGPPWPRSVGVILSWLVILALVGWTLWLLATVNL
ncbi:MAPEG family protein [uncultured Parasphingopyxis sp.]|uniref:MAPEG family protein n=1 Tax=uncultured Parasphingopyxis sp. TaxID=1547918 RepID=UPI002621F00E|nr:MAPEG family protein [uncultured Parasphingopyxis sp.]